MGNIRVEFKINEPVGDSKGQEKKAEQVRALLQAKLGGLQESIDQSRVKSASSVRNERDIFDGRERWKIYLEGNGGLELFATGLRNDAASILTGKDELLVSVLEDD